MNYDCIIMNPPYDGNLHLKIVEKAIELLKDENSICVNLSPVRWIQDPLAKYKNSGVDYKRFEDIRKALASLTIINGNDASKMFGAHIPFDLGIYCLTKGNTETYEYSNAIVDKVIGNKGFIGINTKVESNRSDGIRVRIADNRPIPFGNRTFTENLYKKVKLYLTHNVLSFVYKDGYTPDGKIHWSQNVVVKSGHEHGLDEQIPSSIKFDTLENAQNFENTTKQIMFMYLHYCMKVGTGSPVNYLPWLGEVENPRTHKMGYESDWTNEDLCKYFGITGFISDTEAEPGSEWETILETMKPYL